MSSSTAITEQTPLLTSTEDNPHASPTATAPPPSRLPALPSLTLASIALCLLTTTGGFIFTLLINTTSVHRGSIPDALAGCLLITSQIVFYTLIISALNYARLRRSGREIPWWLNIIVDVLVVPVSIYTSLLYFVLHATLSSEEGYCYGYGRDYSRERCLEQVLVARRVGLAIEIPLFMLGVVHALLLWRRCFAGRVGDYRTSAGGGNGMGTGGGWFIGVGRGPLEVREVGRGEQQQHHHQQSV